MHSKFSQISMVRLDSASQDEYFYGRSDNLARDVRRSLDYCSPGIFMFPIYDQFLEENNDIKDMLFVYVRIVSAFPSYKYKLSSFVEFPSSVVIMSSKYSCYIKNSQKI